MDAKLIARITIAMLIGLALIFVLAQVQKCTRETKATKATKETVHNWEQLYHLESQKLSILEKEKAKAYQLADSLLIQTQNQPTLKQLLPSRPTLLLKRGGDGLAPSQTRGGDNSTIAIDTNRYDSIRTLALQKEELLNQANTIIQQLKTLDSLENISNSKKDSATIATISELTKPKPKPKPKRFSVNLSGGYGYTIGSPTPAPQIGITVGFKLFSF